jgi:hypothetical protein
LFNLLANISNKKLTDFKNKPKEDQEAEILRLMKYNPRTQHIVSFVQTTPPQSTSNSPDPELTHIVKVKESAIPANANKQKSLDAKLNIILKENLALNTTLSSIYNFEMKLILKQT